MFRSPLPGEVWDFNNDTSHAFLCLLKKKQYFKPDNDHVNFWVQNFETLSCFSVTPTDTDRVLFDTLVADARESAEEAGRKNGQKKALSCGHTAKKHLEVVEEWAEEHITVANKFSQARSEMKNASVEEKLWGKQGSL